MKTIKKTALIIALVAAIAMIPACVLEPGYSSGSARYTVTSPSPVTVSVAPGPSSTYYPKTIVVSKPCRPRVVVCRPIVVVKPRPRVFVRPRPRVVVPRRPAPRTVAFRKFRKPETRRVVYTTYKTARPAGIPVRKPFERPANRKQAAGNNVVVNVKIDNNNNPKIKQSTFSKRRKISHSSAYRSTNRTKFNNGNQCNRLKPKPKNSVDSRKNQPRVNRWVNVATPNRQTGSVGFSMADPQGKSKPDQAVSKPGNHGKSTGIKRGKSGKTQKTFKGRDKKD